MVVVPWLLSLLEKKVAPVKCTCGWCDSVAYIINECPQVILADVRLHRLYSADSGTVNWLEQMAVKALAK